MIVFGRRKKPLKNSRDKSQEFLLRLFNHLSIFNSTKRPFCVFRDRQTESNFFSHNRKVTSYLRFSLPRAPSCFGFMDRNILAKSRRKSRQRCQVGAMKTIGSAPRGKVERNSSKEFKDEEEGSSGSLR